MPAAPGAAIPAEGLPPGRDTERVMAQGCSCSLCLSVELGVDRGWRVLGQGSSPSAPHHRTSRGREQTKAMRRATRRLCASKHSPSCQGRTVPMSSQSL